MAARKPQNDERPSGGFKGSPVVGYVRSARRGDPQLDEWEAQIRAYCAERGYNLVEIVRDEGVSGVAVWKPGLERVVRGVERGEFIGVLTPRLDHFGRQPSDRKRVIERIAAVGWTTILDNNN